MHRGSETKFPWWYFLHTGGILAGQWGAATLYTKTFLSLPRSFAPCFQSLLLSLPLPLLTFEVPPKLQPPHSTHTIPPGLGWLRFVGLGVPSSDQKVRGSYSQSRAPNCFGWEDGYVSWRASEQKVLHFTKNVHFPSENPKHRYSKKIPFMLKSES